MERQIGRGTRWARWLLVAPLLAATLAVGAPAPAGAAYACTTFITGGTIRDSVVVPAGQLCVLTDVVVRDGVTVEAGAAFQVQEDSQIRGSVAALGHRDLFVFNSEVRGNLTVAGGTSVSSVIGGEIRGDVTISGNSGDQVELLLVSIQGSATVAGNHVANHVQISRNVIDVDLVCEDNIPEPTSFGADSTVGGVKSGQCAGL